MALNGNWIFEAQTGPAARSSSRRLSRESYLKYLNGMPKLCELATNRVNRKLRRLALWLLAHEDLVAIEVFKHDACSPGTSCRFTVEFHSPLLHSLVITKTIVCA